MTPHEHTTDEKIKRMVFQTSADTSKTEEPCTGRSKLGKILPLKSRRSLWLRRLKMAVSEALSILWTKLSSSVVMKVISKIKGGNMKHLILIVALAGFSTSCAAQNKPVESPKPSPAQEAPKDVKKVKKHKKAEKKVEPSASPSPAAVKKI